MDNEQKSCFYHCNVHDPLFVHTIVSLGGMVIKCILYVLLLPSRGELRSTQHNGSANKKQHIRSQSDPCIKNTEVFI